MPRKPKPCEDCGEMKRTGEGRYCRPCSVDHNSGCYKKGDRHRLGAKYPEEGKKKLSCIFKGVRRNPSGEFKKGQTSGSNNINWKGDEVGYYALHMWLKRNYSWSGVCEMCNGDDNVQIASRDYSYTRNREDYMELCYKCHRKYDSENGWGVASRLFNL